MVVEVQTAVWVGLFIVVVLAVMVRLARGEATAPSVLLAALQELRETVERLEEEFAEFRAQIPRRVAGRYQIGDRIGEGGIGQVYDAVDLVAQRFVALKLLKPQYTEDPDTRRRFKREAKIAARLSHLNAVRTLHYGEDSTGELFVVMDLHDGRTLRDVLDDSEGGLHPIEAVTIARQMASVLVEAHACGIVHRDIKPENILSTPHGYLLADWGLGFIVSGSTSVARGTENGLVAGTVAYMSPEQTAGAHDVGPPTDVYSLGVLLFELLEGRLPFGGNAQAIIVAHSCAARPSPLIGPKGLRAFVPRMMAVDPSQRPSAQEVHDALEIGLIDYLNPDQTLDQ